MKKYVKLIVKNTLKISLLCCSVAYGADMTDEALTAQVARQYASFRGCSIPNIDTPVCKAVQFVYSLTQSQTPDSYLGRKLALLISRGAGVGGIDEKRQATEDEMKVLFTGISYAAVKGAKDENFKTTCDPTTVTEKHQHMVFAAFNELSDCEEEKSATPTNFVQKPEMLQPFVRAILPGYVTKTGDFNVLTSYVSRENIEKIKTKYRPIGFGTQNDFYFIWKSIKHLLRMPNKSEEQNEFVRYAFRLLCDSDATEILGHTEKENRQAFVDFIEGLSFGADYPQNLPENKKAIFIKNTMGLFDGFNIESIGGRALVTLRETLGNKNIATKFRVINIMGKLPPFPRGYAAAKLQKYEAVTDGFLPLFYLVAPLLEDDGSFLDSLSKLCALSRSHRDPTIESMPRISQHALNPSELPMVLLEILRSPPGREIEVTKQAAKLLVTNMPPYSSVFVIELLNRLSPEDAEDFSTQAARLCNLNAYRENSLEVLESVEMIEKSRRPEFVDFVVRNQGNLNPRKIRAIAERYKTRGFQLIGELPPVDPQQQQAKREKQLDTLRRCFALYFKGEHKSVKEMMTAIESDNL